MLPLRLGSSILVTLTLKGADLFMFLTEQCISLIPPRLYEGFKSHHLSMVMDTSEDVCKRLWIGVIGRR